MPESVPTRLAVPIRPKPACVGERSFFYELKDAFPAEDLEISYPEIAAPPALKTPADWDAWTRTLGGPQVEMNCALLERVKKDAGPELDKRLADRSCRASCAAKR